MNLEKQTSIAKLIPPILLKILVILMIGLGIFFRFAHLGQKAIWYDEVFTSLAISGHTVAEVQQEVFNENIIPITALDKYQHLNPDRGINETVRYLITSDPQHPPLYYVMLRLWVQVFGDSSVGLRSLSAAISLLVFPSVYWLCLELFESPIVGWVTIALMAVSPLQIFLAQDARQYGLWMVTILVSSAALLRAIRRENLASWAIYAITLALGLYTHLFTVLIAISHGIYVIFRHNFRFNKSLVNYLLGTSVGIFIFLPWLFVVITHISTAQQLTSWLSSIKIDNPFDLIAIFLTRLTRIFFDVNLGSENTWDNKFILESKNLYYSIISVVFSLNLVLYIGYCIVKKCTKSISLFLLLLGGVPALCLLLPDLIGGGIRSITFRYQLPLYLSIQIAVAYVLSFHLFFEKHWRQKVWQFLIVGVLIAGLVSDVMFFKADTWWTQARNQSWQIAAKYINKFDSPLLVTNDNIVNIGASLYFSHLLKPKINLLSIQSDHLPPLPQEINNIFLWDDNHTNNQDLVVRFEDNKTYSVSLIDPVSELWQIEKIQNK
ncbi:glycosyltransferase family 39 protein [Nostoc sp.]|uniref:glycosyltransferase family 39 protein n=1 Tax=Nostoc sp. TaxID=1180 RepID=UPI002FFCE94D